MTLEELEKRLQATEAALAETQGRLRVVEDIEQIKQLQYRYLNAVMYTDWDIIPDMFAEDGAIKFGKNMDKRTGKAAILEYFKGHIAQHHVGLEGDFEIHPLIKVDGDKATGNWVKQGCKNG